MVPLPPEFLRSISQNVFEVYATALGSSQLGWRPLSLSVFDTWRALTQAITCGILFYFTAIYRPAFFPGQATKPRGLCSIFWRGPSQDPFLNGLLALAALTAGFEAFYGLGEYLAGHQRIYFFSRSVSAEGAAGTFVNRNHFANYLVLFYPLLFSWLAGGLVSTKQGLPPASSFRGQGLWLAFVLTAVTIAIVVSHSRMAILSSGIAFLFLVASFLWVTPSRKGVLLLLGCSAVAVLFLFFLDPGFASFQSRIHLFFQGYDRSRFRVWQDSFQIVRDVPWTGTGLETFQFIFPKYSSVPITLRFTHGHSDWLELLVETGIPGFLTFALAVMWFFIFYVQRLKHLPATIRPIGVGILISLAAFLIHSSAEFNFHIPANAYSFAIVTGMGVRLFDQARGK